MVSYRSTVQCSSLFGGGVSTLPERAWGAEQDDVEATAAQTLNALSIKTVFQSPVDLDRK